MVDVMPIIIAPKLRKEELIDQLADYVRSSGLLVDVCNSAVKGLSKDYLHMILRQYDPKADQKRPRSAMIDHFTKLNMPEADENLRDDGPCLAIVPYLADCGARTADFHAQVVDYESCGRKLRKTQRKMNKKWMKGARLLRRQFLSKAIVAELKRCLRGNGFLMQWTVASLRDHVSSVVDKPLHSGHARVFFNKKIQEVLCSKYKKPWKKKAALITHKHFAVPRKNFTLIADPEQWREMVAMRTQDMRT